MAVSDDILASYRGPRRVLARILAAPRREDRPLGYLIAALIVGFIALWPGMARDAHFAPEVPLGQRMLGAALGMLVLVPVFYLLAGASAYVAKLIWGRLDFYGARVALFWALLAASPLMLLQGLVSGFIGGGPQLTLTGALVFCVFAWFWISGLRLSALGGEHVDGA
ncbi:YIP1 family protein [Phaeovulum sp. W22_SRMD_FR3]|uniref:YIP1 family protein n=1 Tax=Phaeovulum sp. W22_SRMD_FR3 TaxID=3240274 RepID=UPI003F959657